MPCKVCAFIINDEDICNIIKRDAWWNRNAFIEQIRPYTIHLVITQICITWVDFAKKIGVKLFYTKSKIQIHPIQYTHGYALLYSVVIQPAMREHYIRTDNAITELPVFVKFPFTFVQFLIHEHWMVCPVVIWQHAEGYRGNKKNGVCFTPLVYKLCSRTLQRSYWNMFIFLIYFHICKTRPYVHFSSYWKFLWLTSKAAIQRPENFNNKMIP